MASHSHTKASDEKLELSGSGKVMTASLVVGLIGLAVAIGSALGMYDLRRFFFAYLTAWAFFLSLGVGGLFFVLLQYVTRAGWSVTVRRVPEALAKTLPMSLLLALPILYSISRNDGILYRWAQPAAAEHHASAGGEQHHANDGHDHSHDAHGHAASGHEPGTVTSAVSGNDVEKSKAALEAENLPPGHYSFPTRNGKVVRANGDKYDYEINSPMPVENGKPVQPEEPLVTGKKEGFFLLGNWTVIIRSVLSLVALSLVAWWYTSQSKKQDVTGDESITVRLSVRSAPMLVIFGLATTFIAFDLLMSLDPVWISTIFGGYYFAGSVVSMFAFTILVCSFLQKKGYLTNSINTEHYHDLSKFQFAFTFFWGYLAFSQFMLLWYSSQPEELTWLARRGASTAAVHLGDFSPWTYVSLILLFGHLLLPFPGLLSRHVKRNPFGRMFWANWIIVFHFVDLFWVVMPEYDGSFFFGLPEIAAVVGVGGLFLFMFIRGLAGAALRPLRDPRLEESLGFHQSF